MRDTVIGILEWFLGNILWDLFFAALIAAGITWLRARQSKWSSPLLFGLLSFCAAMVTIVAFTGKAVLESPKTTAENVELNVRAWADRFSIGSQKQEQENYIFRYLLTSATGRKFFVGRPKNRAEYLEFGGFIKLDDETNRVLNALPAQQVEKIEHEIAFEMARNKTAFGITTQPRAIFVTKILPITGNLTEDVFVAACDEMDGSILFAQESLIQAFAHNSEAVKLLPARN